MYQNSDQLINELFEYNLKKYANKLQLVNGEIEPFSTPKAVKLLNIAEDLSRKPGDNEKIKSLLICGILCENRIDEWQALSAFVSRILIRIGLNTSARMVGWNTEFNVFNSLGSYIEELFSTNTIIEHEVNIADKTITLSSFQKRMWDAIELHNRIGISAPTSAGKSFVLVNKIIDILSQTPGKVVFIVPTISLINQVSNDFRKKFKEYNITDISVSQTVSEFNLFKNDKIIYVLTQERALSALHHESEDFKDVKIVVIDEVQNVEKVSAEDEERAKTLYEVIQEFKNDIKPEKIIIAGPRLKNLHSIVTHWFGEDSTCVSEEIPPVINISYGFKKKKKGVLSFVQYLPLNIKNSIDVEDNFQLIDKILGKVKYNDETYDFITRLIQSDLEAGNIVFSQSTRQATSTAVAISERIKMPKEINDTKVSLKKYIADTVHPYYALISSIDKGIAYHHSKMPNHIRNLVEKSFTKKYIHTVVSTTTLMQGINLPAKNIIIRNPKVADQTLTGYEFTNLKGRAGRLMQDLVGRAIIIDEQQCENADIQLSLFQEKDLKVGYADRYKAGKNTINDTLEKSKEVSIDSETVNDLIVYVRIMALKYGSKALFRINEVGINISQEQLDQTLKALSTISIPAKICLSNPHWDPLVLDRLYNEFVNREWPSVPGSINGCHDHIQKLIFKMRDFSPFYFKKYFDINDDRKIWSLSLFAESWGLGRPLKDVINPQSWPIKESDDIDSRIADLYTKVTYGIPKLLRPAFQISDSITNLKSSSLLSFIEVGSVKSDLRSLIEIGIPRETALRLLSVMSANFLDTDDRIIESKLKKYITDIKQSPRVNEWDKLLIEEM